jgi:ABC-2 type transport system permease protein
MQAVLAMAGKDARLLLRDKGGAFVTFVFPFIYSVFFGLIFASRSGTGSTIGIVVVDEDGSDRSMAFIQKLEEAAEFRVSRATRDQATDAVRRGEKVAYVVVTEGFGEAAGQILFNRRPRIDVGIDPARQAEAAMVKGMLTKYMFEMITTTFTDLPTMKSQIASAKELVRQDEDLGFVRRAMFDRFFTELDRFVTEMNTNDKTNSGAADQPAAPASALAGWQPMEIETLEVTRERTGPKNSYEFSFPQGIIWGVLGCCASFGISLVTERTSGTLARLRVAPIGRTEILAGKAVACFGSTLALASVMMVVGRVVFNVRPGSLVHLVVSLMLIATAFVGIMMFLSILGKTERTVSGVCWAVLLGMAMLGGGMVPQFYMPPWMQSLGNISPVKWAILAMEGAIWRGFSTTEMLVPWVILLLFGAVSFAVGVRGFSWADEGS